ncbi:MAG: hypothetical protein R2826_01375 [Thermoleophilia bacterium]
MKYAICIAVITASLSFMSGCGDSYSGTWTGDWGVIQISQQGDVWHVVMNDGSDITMLEMDGKLVTDDLALLIEKSGPDIILSIRYGGGYDTIRLSRVAGSRSP